MRQEIFQFLEAHKWHILGVATAFYTAAVTAWPENKADFSWYTYLRTVALSVMPIAQRRPPAMPLEAKPEPPKGVTVS